MGAKQKIAGLLFLIGILASSGPVNARNCRTNRDHCGDPGLPQTIPLKIYRNFLVVAEGQFGGVSERQNFVLDTGTAPSIINIRLVRQIGLTTMSSKFTAVGKITSTQAAIIPEIELGPLRAASLPVLVQDLSQLERDWGIPIAGIIGLDVLSKASFHLDYDKKEIEFGDVSHQGIPVRFDARAGIAVAWVRLGGKDVRLLVDTGSDRVVLLGGNIAEVGWLALRNTSQWGTSLAGQDMHIQEFSAPDIILGGQHFSKDRAYFVPGSTDPVFDGLLGVRALGFRGLSYDQTGETIYLQK
jgi:hypothetical protein